MPRELERVQFLEEVELSFASGKRTARVSDISEGGCYVDSIASVPVGEPLTIDMKGPDGSVLEFKGEVAYVLEGFGFGVRFVELSPEQKEFLHQLVSSRLP